MVVVFLFELTDEKYFTMNNDSEHVHDVLRFDQHRQILFLICRTGCKNESYFVYFVIQRQSAIHFSFSLSIVVNNDIDY